MELLQGEAFDDLFRAFSRSAFHLEVRDSYHTGEEATPFQLFLTNQPDDFAWHRPWLSLVREVTGTGRGVNRLRVVTVPHGDYTRWGLTVAALNVDAGENIRWLPRHLVDSESLPGDDFWLFDDNRVVFTVFEPGGQFTTIVGYCRTTQDRLWQTGIPHWEYNASAYMST